MFISLFHNYSYRDNEKSQGSQTSSSQLFVHKIHQLHETALLVIRGKCCLKATKILSSFIQFLNQILSSEETYGGDGQAVLKDVGTLGGIITTSLKSVGNSSPHYYNKLQK